MDFIKIGIVDDHKLFRKGLATLINSFSEYKVVLECSNGFELLEKLPMAVPDLILLDVNMPGMNGLQTLDALKENHYDIKVIGLSMDDQEETIVKMIGLGARGYILKDADPSELKLVLDAVWTKGYSYSEFITHSVFHSLQNKETKPQGNHPQLSERELEFLKWVCEELTYKEIADKMFVSTRTVDGYRDQLFLKLGLKNRVGLALFAVRVGIVKI